MKLPAFQQLNFHIDDYIIPFIPRSRLHRLPKSISWFLGYRGEPHQSIGNIVSWIWSFIGAFCGIALIAGIFKSSAVIQSHVPPIIIGSFVRTPWPYGTKMVAIKCFSDSVLSPPRVQQPSWNITRLNHPLRNPGI